MFVSDRLVFLELQKTGCTHIRNLLKELVGGELVGKHNQAEAGLFSTGRIFLGSVRDPWEWYISLWAYGCDGRGALFDNVTSPGIRFRGRGWKDQPYSAMLEVLTSGSNRHAKEWKRTYRDVSDASAFRDWLRMLHGQAFWPAIGEGYAQCALSRVAGLLTYRYMKLYACTKGESDGLGAISTFARLVEYERENCFVDFFVRNENLEADLLAALKLAGIEISRGKEADVLSRPRTNVSSRSKGPEYYYDAGTEHLIANRDQLVMDKFGYAPPSARS